MFKRKRVQERPSLKTTRPINFPTGTVVETEKGIYYIKGQRRFLVSSQVLESWSFSRIVLAAEANLAKYRVAGKFGFREGSLIKDIFDGKMYLISENKRRHIQSPDALTIIGAQESDALLVHHEDINLHLEGEPLSVRI